MGARLEKLYAFAFFQLRSFFRAVLDDGLEDWKALVILGGAEISALMAAVSIATVATGGRIALPPEPMDLLAGLSVAVGLMVLNYRVLLLDKRWARFEAEFRRYSQLCQPRHPDLRAAYDDILIENWKETGVWNDPWAMIP